MGVNKEEKKIEEIKAFIDKNKKCPACNRPYGGLLLSRTPKSIMEFKVWAKEEFCNDYGMALKWLWDFYTGILGKGHERAEAKADEALNQVAELSKQPEEKENERTKVMCDGSIRRF